MAANPYDKAYELAKSISESQEFRDIEAALEAVKDDPDSKRMMDDFAGRQAELQMRMMQGEQVSEEELSKIEKLYEVISLNAKVRKVFDAERRLGVLMEDIQRIMAEPLARLHKSE